MYKNHLAILLTIWLLSLSSGANAITVPGPVNLQIFSISGIGQPVDLDLLTTGDLYIDYAPFLNGNTINIPSGVQFIAGGSFSIFTPGNIPTAWPHGAVAITALDDGSPIDISGDALVFIDGPINSAIFESSGNIVLGDYSALASVPIPPPIVLFASGLMFLLHNVSRRAG